MNDPAVFGLRGSISGPHFSAVEKKLELVECTKSRGLVDGLDILCIMKLDLVFEGHGF